MSDTNHAASVELLKAAFVEESKRQLDRLESIVHYAELAERERHSKMICVLVNPNTKRPTAFEPNDDPPGSFTPIFDGPYQNAAMVTEDERRLEMARLCSLRADELVAEEQERCAKMAAEFDDYEYRGVKVEGYSKGTYMVIDGPATMSALAMRLRGGQ